MPEKTIKLPTNVELQIENEVNTIVYRIGNNYDNQTKPLKYWRDSLIQELKIEKASNWFKMQEFAKKEAEYKESIECLKRQIKNRGL